MDRFPTPQEELAHYESLERDAPPHLPSPLQDLERDQRANSIHDPNFRRDLEAWEVEIRNWVRQQEHANALQLEHARLNQQDRANARNRGA